MKTCSLCKETKPTADFNKKRNGLTSYCKSCNKQYHKVHYARNKSSYRAKNDLRRKELALWINELKSKPCTDCKCTFDPIAMDFDHKESKKDSISNLVRDGVSIQTLEKEIEKCDLVCACCHRIRTRNRLALSSNGKDPSLSSLLSEFKSPQGHQ